MCFRKLALLIIAVLQLFLVQTGRTQIHGYLVTFYNHDITSYGLLTNDQQNAFHLKRIYLTTQHDISERFSLQVTLEANANNIGTSGNFEPYIKYAYLKWKNIIPYGDIYIGLSQSPVWARVEKLWSYWSVEKTMLDIHSLGHPCDFGLALKGKVNEKGTMAYHFMVGNGKGHKPETDQYKKFYSSIVFYPISSFFGEIVADYEKRSSTSSVKTYKVAFGFKKSNFTVGLEMVRRYESSPTEFYRQGISLFTHKQITQQLTLLARFDHYNPNTDDDLLSEELWILGVDYRPNEKVHIIPNVWMKTYKNDQLEPDLVGKMTFHFIF